MGRRPHVHLEPEFLEYCALLDEVERLRAIAEAAEDLLRALDNSDVFSMGDPQDRLRTLLSEDEGSGT